MYLTGGDDLGLQQHNQTSALAVAARIAPVVEEPRVRERRERRMRRILYATMEATSTVIRYNDGTIVPEGSLDYLILQNSHQHPMWH